MKNIILIIIISISLISCETVLMDDIPENNPQENFNYLWTYAKEHYTFFDYKKIDWDSVKMVHEKRITPSMSNDSLFAVLSDMTLALKDGHTNLISDLGISGYLDYYLDRPANYDSYILHKNYLEPNNYELLLGFEIMEIGDVGYMNYTSFNPPITDKQMDYILTKFKNKKGVIVDLRNNQGGDSDNIDRLVGRFTDEKTLAGYNSYKNGPGENDYSQQISCYVHPQGSVRYTGRVIVLTNRMVYSAANFATLYFKALPNVTLIGDITGGGGGIPTYAELPNGWVFSCSSTSQITPDGINTENGIEPDIYESFESAGPDKDGILERAIVEINK